MRIEVAISAAGPWYEVFEWGDGPPDFDPNTNIYVAGYGVTAEPYDQLIPLSSPPLYGAVGGIASGIAIDIDARVPAGTYGFVRLTGTSGSAEVDGIEVLP